MAVFTVFVEGIFRVLLIKDFIFFNFSIYKYIYFIVNFVYGIYLYII